MKHPQPYADTDPRAMEVWIELLRKMTPAQKISSVFQLTQFAQQVAEMGVRAQYPEAGDREIFLRTAARHLSRDEMIHAYGWDPASGRPS